MSVNVTENVLPVPFPWIFCILVMHLHLTALKTKEVSDLSLFILLFFFFFWQRVLEQCMGVLLALSFNKQNGLSGRRTVFEGRDVGGRIV